MEYLNKEGLFNDSKPTLKEKEFYENKVNNLIYDEKPFIDNFNWNDINYKITFEDIEYHYKLWCEE